MSPTHTLTNPTRFKPLLEAAPHLQAVLQVARQFQVKPYLVGGAVRDLLYKGTLSTDLDLMVPAEQAEAIAHMAAQAIHGKCICLDEHYRIYRVIVFPGLEMLDIAGCIGDSLHADLLRRDITVNAMAYDFETGEIIDPHGGMADLENGVIRMVSEANMLEDPLRLIRVFRIGAELGFTQIDPATLAVVQRYGERLIRAAAERIHYELMKLLSAKTCARHVRLMADTGLLEHIFPELSPMHFVPGNMYHHLGLYDHTLELLVQAEQHFVDLPPEVQDYLYTPFNPFTKRIALVRLACLFHDVGKPPTMAFDPQMGKFMFWGHDAVSEELVYGIATRLKWGKEITRCVAQLVRWHLYPGDMLRPEVSEKGYRKFFRRVGDWLPELILLAIADRYSAQGPAILPEELERSKAGYLSLFSQFQTFQAAEESKPRLLTGGEVMALLSLAPGPAVGKIVNAVHEAYLNGEISTAEEAVRWVQSHYEASSAG